jgi:MFS family permease
MTQFVIVIDASIVNVALPSIGAHLHFSRDDLTWGVNAYTLTFGGFLLLGGRMADLLGRRRLFSSGSSCSHSPRWPAAWRSLRPG